MFKSLYKHFFPEITYVWSVVGNTIGKHHWYVDRVCCKSGLPEISGGLLTVITCESEKSAHELCEELQKIAVVKNKKNGYG